MCWFQAIKVQTVSNRLNLARITHPNVNQNRAVRPLGFLCRVLRVKCLQADKYYSWF